MPTPSLDEVIIYGAVLVALLIAVVIWVFAKKRKARFEKDAKIPFEDRDD